MRTAEIQNFWRAYRHHEGLQHDNYQSTYYRTDAVISGRMISRIAAGVKRAVAAPAHYFAVGEAEPMPAVGDHVVLLDHRRRPRLIWWTTEVIAAPLSSVTEEFVWRDGASCPEDYLTVARALFEDQARRHGFEMHDAVETVFESFDVVWPPAAVRRSKLLASQFEQGLALIRRLNEARAAAQDLIAVLDQVETAVMVVGPRRQLRCANMAAERILRRNDGFRVKDGRLGVRDPDDEHTLSVSVSRAFREPDDLRGSVPQVTIKRIANRPPYRLRVIGMRNGRRSRGHAEEPLALLITDDPENGKQRQQSDEDLLIRSFSLTPAELRLAVQLASGVALIDAANALGVTYNTARSQLRAIFEKSDVHRQSELVLLLRNMRTLRLSPS